MGAKVFGVEFNQKFDPLEAELIDECTKQYQFTYDKKDPQGSFKFQKNELLQSHTLVPPVSNPDSWAK